MKESAQAALTYVRSASERLAVDEDFFQKHDVHVHIPAGAVPKDGPSAGVAMTVALASMVSGRAVDPDVAMTGEVTLTGQVLPVGGIKEKVLAAQTAGITRVFLPDRNRADVDEIRGDDLVRGLQFCYVEHVGAVLDQILVPPRRRRPAAVCAVGAGTPGAAEVAAPRMTSRSRSKAAEDRGDDGTA